MKAMIFAAGTGSRLKPLTDTKPKALIEVGGKPLLQHVIEKLKASGFTYLVINVHHLADQIIDFLQANGNFGIEIHIADERDYLLDTGGGIKNARNLLEGEDPFLVHNVDILSNVDLKEVYESHINSEALATLVVSKRKTSRYLMFDKQNRLSGWKNKETGEIKSYFPDFDPSRYEEYAFSGIHVLSPEIFEWMDEWTGKFPIINFYLSIAAKADLRAYPAEHLQLLDVGKPETLQQAEDLFKV